MSDISLLCGAVNHESLDALLTRMSTQPAWNPFDARAIAYVGRFSRKLLTHARIREFPELAALGHWFRPARLQQLATEHAAAAGDARIVGRGMAFHVAPSNVDSVSMYSWILSLLSGNSNIVRVSQKRGAQLDFVIDILNDLATEPAGEPVAPRIALITYAHDTAITQSISARCQLRVVWGGDATVATIRAIPLRATATEVVFPDRFSLAALHADHVLALAADELAKLVHGFYNDAFWFAQQACSSPRVVYWVGTDAACAAAGARFWQAVEAEVARRSPEDSSAMVVARLAASFELAAIDAARPASGAIRTGQPLRLALEKGLSAAVKEVHCGNGLFLEGTLPVLSALASVLSDREQTLSVSGFDRSAIDELLDVVPTRSLDRIVPIGSALDFSSTWDGVDLFTAFTRRIEVVLT